MENGAVISSNVLKHDVPPILEGSTDGIVAKKTPSLPQLYIGIGYVAQLLRCWVECI